jgi:ABC-type lipoprotein release transport system permease subunit
MGAVWLTAWHDLRRRWGSLAGVALLVAVVTAAVLTALVGAQRTSTTVERFRDWAGASDASFQASDWDTGAAMLDKARSLPQVEAATNRNLVNAFLVDAPISDIALMTDRDDVYGRGIDRPRILAGRLPRADAPNEVMLNELASRLTGFGVGDRLKVRTWSASDLEALFAGTEFPGFNGPVLDLRVVGVGRMLEELPGEVRRTSPFAIASPALLDAHPGVAAWPPAVFTRLRDGAGDIDAVAAALAPAAGLPAGSDLHPQASTASEVYEHNAQRAVDSLATGLLVFALGAAVAGAIAVGQAVTRQEAGAASWSATLRALGLSRGRTATAVALPVTVAAAVGVALGGGAAVVASSLLPTGLARRAEVDPGRWWGLTLLVPGAIVLFGLIAGACLLLARRTLPAGAGRHRGADGSGRRLPIATRAVVRAGGSPTIVTGVRLAHDRGRSGTSVPVRSAVVGLAIGVAGVVAAGVIATSLHDLTAHPANWGWAWSSSPDYFGEGDEAQLAPKLVADDRLDAVGRHVVGSVILGGEPVTTHAIVSLKGSLAMTILDGRFPSGPGEIALGRDTLRRLDVSIGDRVRASMAPGSTTDLTVVGTVVLPATEDINIDEGAALTLEGLDRVNPEDADDPLSSLVLRYPDGADAASLEAALAADHPGLGFGPFTQPQPPGSIRNLDEGRGIGVALAAFFATIGGVGLVHALLVSTRRRRTDLATLRALGLRRRQVRGAVLVQALVLGAFGTLVGVPAGLVAGRFVWRVLVSDIGAAADPGTPWALLLVTLPLVAVAAGLASWWPGRTAVGALPAHQLRTE